MSGTKRITRREFTVGVLSGAVGLRAAAVAAPAGKKVSPYRGVSCQTYVWSQVLGEQKKNLGDCLDQVFAEIRAAGCRGVETMAEFLDKPDFSDLLAKQRLRLTGVYSGAALHEREKAKPVLARLADLGPRVKALGCDVLVVNPNPIGREKTDAELATQTAMLNELGRMLHESGVALNVHTHAPEMRSNGREFCSNLDNTDPSLVGLCADVDWIRRGGGDPYELLTRYAARIGSCHLRNSVGGVWSESLGDGDTDYRRIAKIFAGIEKRIYLTVELAYEPKTPRTRPLAEDAALSRKYVRTVFGV